MRSRHLGVMCVVALLGVAVTSVGATTPDWPPFLRASDDYPVHVADAIRKLWREATFTRMVTAEPAAVPLPFYLRFVDAPDVTAAAARHLGLTTYTVTPLGQDWYEADDGNRTRGVYQVLARYGSHRVILSWGTHHGSLLGTIGGSALSRLEFGDDHGQVTQRLAVNAIIDNGLVARLTRPALALFGWFVDRKLSEAFRTATAAAAWAHAKPEEFCAWLGGALTAARLAQLRDVFDECAAYPPATLSHRSHRSSPRIQ